MKRTFAIAVMALASWSTAFAQYDDVWNPKKDGNLYNAMGGVHQVAAVVDNFADRMSMDQKVMMNPACKMAFSKEALPFFKYEMTEWLAQQWGGPQKYMGPDMVAWHRAAKISEDEWKAGAMHFHEAMDKFMVKKEVQKDVDMFFTSFHNMVAMKGSTDVTMPMADKETLYMRLGGTPAIAAVVDEFVNRLAMDETTLGNKNVVKSLTSGKVTPAGIKFLVVQQIVMASGGPAKYSGRDMASAHKGLMITEAEWEASAKVFKAVLDDFKVPAREQGELFSAITASKKDIVGR